MKIIPAPSFVSAKRSRRGFARSGDAIRSPQSAHHLPLPKRSLRAKQVAMGDGILSETFPEIREAVRRLCARFPGEYWQKLDRERAWQRDAGRTEDMVEGVMAFFQKREAKFKGE